MDEATVARVHERARVFDGHTDVFNDVVWRRGKGERQVLARRHLPELRAGGVDGFVAAVYVEPIFKPYQALPRALQLLGAGLDDLAESPETFRVVREGADLTRAAEAGQIAVILSLEGAEPVEYSPEALRVFYEAGIRTLGLTWNQRNHLADGVTEIGVGGGLTVQGERVVREANRLGVVIDVSHLAPACIDHTLRLSTRPIIASHANAAALHEHPRNLSDDRLRAVVASGGIVGVVPVAKFLAPSGATMDHVVQQLEYLMELVGERNVGLGLDFTSFMYTEDAGLARHIFTGGAPDPVDGCSELHHLPELTRRLLARGHSEATVQGVLGDNFTRFYSEVL